MGRLEIFLVLTFSFFIYLQRVESACGESAFLAKVGDGVPAGRCQVKLVLIRCKHISLFQLFHKLNSD